MGLTRSQDLPGVQKHESEGWTVRTLLSLSGLAKSIYKTIESPFEWMFAFCLFVIAIGELAHAKLSWFFYVVAFILLFSIIVRRALAGMNDEEEEKPHKK